VGRQLGAAKCLLVSNFRLGGRLLLLAGAMCLYAQDRVIRTTVPLILVPVTVTDRHGNITDGLTESDFELLDNGKLVKHHLEATNQPIALVVAVQTSAIAGPVLAKVQKIGSMFEPLVVGDRGVAAILTYSDRITVRQDFTGSADDFTARIRAIEPDGSSRTEARMNDAVLKAVKMLAGQSKFRRVMVVVGESRDRGSQAALQEAVTSAQSANVTVYAVNYSVYKTSFTSRGDERFEGSGRRVYDTDPGNLLAVFTEIGRLGTQNAGDALARYTGGEKFSFAKLSALERVITKVGENLHSQYLLSFQPGPDAAKSYHEITVNVKRAEAVARARPGYWPE
jgi:VWFA-related protein